MTPIQAINASLDELDGEFEYGRRDCCQFVALVVEKLYGRQVMPIEYSSEAEAMEYVDRMGGLEEAVTAELGEPCTPHGALKDGRPCLVILPFIGKVMGIVLGNEAVLLGQYRTVRAPMSLIHKVWKL